MPTAIRINDVDFAIADGQPPLLAQFWDRAQQGAWEPDTFRILDRFLGPGRRLVDIGAWVGALTLYAAAKGSRVDAFECDPVALGHLRTNLEANPALAPAVRVMPTALGDADGALTLFSTGFGNSESSIYASHQRGQYLLRCGQSVQVAARDALGVFRAAGYADDSRTLVKIDVEGSEFVIVPRLAGLIAASRCTWLVSFHELNVNPGDVPAKHARIAEMLRALLCFRGLRWFNEKLQQLDKARVLDAVLAGTLPPHLSFVFQAAPEG
jgi:FkbM family methyltransferase